MGWKFAKTEDMTTSGANNQAFETFDEDGSIIREIIQNSLDAKRTDCDHVIVEIELSERKTSSFPDKKNLLETLNACKEQFEKSDKKSTQKIEDMITSLNTDSHYIVSYRDINTNGLIGSWEDQRTNLFQLVYGNGTTNKNTNKSSGGSFGIGKNAPFTRTSIKSIFYDTYNIDEEHYIIGKSILTSHVIDDEMRVPNGYYKDDGKILDYLSDISMGKRYGTCVHIPFYMMKNKSVEEETQVLIRDVLMNFMVAIHRGRLEVKFINNITEEKKVISQDTFNDVVNEYLQNNKSDDKYKKIKAMHNLLTNPEVTNHKIYITEGDEENYIELYMALNGASTNFKRYFNLREQLMLIEDVKIRGKNFKFDGMAIYHGSKLNNVLRDAEPPEHNKWKKSSLRTQEQQNYFKTVKDTVEAKMIELFGEVTSEKIVLKEFNNNIFSESKEYDEVYKIKKIDEKLTLKDKGESNELGTVDIWGRDKKSKAKTKSKDKSQISQEGNQEANIIVLNDVTQKIRYRGNGKYFVSLKEGYDPRNEEIRVYSRTDTGQEERLTNFEVLLNEKGNLEIKVEDVDLDIRVALEEQNEIKK